MKERNNCKVRLEGWAAVICTAGSKCIIVIQCKWYITTAVCTCIGVLTAQSWALILSSNQFRSVSINTAGSPEIWLHKISMIITFHEVT